MHRHHHQHRHTRRLPRPAARLRGFTLVEAAAVLAVLSVLASAAWPAFRQVLERRHVEGAAAQFETDLHYARSEAVAQGRTLRLGFDNAAACYVLHDGAHGDCTCRPGRTPVCRDGVQPLRSAALPAGAGLRLASNVPSMSIDGRFGTVSPATTVRFEAAGGAALNQVVNVMGRVRTCAPATAWAGVRAC